MRDFQRFKRVMISVVLLGAALWLSACSSPTAPTTVNSTAATPVVLNASTDNPAQGNPEYSAPSNAPTGLTANGTGNFHSDGKEPIVFDWNPVVHAIFYRLEVQREENNEFFNYDAFIATRTTTYAYAPGLYRVRIQAVYSIDLASTWSDWVVFGSGAHTIVPGSSTPPTQNPPVCYTNPLVHGTVVPCDSVPDPDPDPPSVPESPGDDDNEHSCNGYHYGQGNDHHDCGNHNGVENGQGNGRGRNPR